MPHNQCRLAVLLFSLLSIASAAYGEQAATREDWGSLTWEGELAVSYSYSYRDHESVTDTDYQGLTRLRTQMELGFDYRGPGGWRAYGRGFGFYDHAYWINGMGDYTGDVLDDYRWEADTREVWVSGPIGTQAFVQAGRQIVNWGRSETLRVLDVWNPVTRLEPGIADLDELRRPIGMLRAELELGEWAIEGLFVPEMRVDRMPSWGNDFFPSSFPVPTPLLRASEERPDDFEDFEWGFRLSRSFRGFDLSLNAARVYANEPHFAPGVNRRVIDTLPDYTAQIWHTARFRYSRSWLVGAGAAWATGSWLLKGELAFREGLDFTSAATLSGLDAVGNPIALELPIGTLERDRLDGMLGVEYFGFRDTTIALDFVERYMPNFRSSLKPYFQRRHAQEFSLRIRSTFFRQRLTLMGLGFYARRGTYDGGFLRFQADYDFGKGLSARGGIALFIKGDLLPFDTINRNDRLFGQLVYAF